MSARTGSMGDDVDQDVSICRIVGADHVVVAARPRRLLALLDRCEVRSSDDVSHSGLLQFERHVPGGCAQFCLLPGKTTRTDGAFPTARHRFAI
jgi:hypothetical protein